MCACACAAIVLYIHLSFNSIQVSLTQTSSMRQFLFICPFSFYYNYTLLLLFLQLLMADFMGYFSFRSIAPKSFFNAGEYKIKLVCPLNYPPHKSKQKIPCVIIVSGVSICICIEVFTTQYHT